MLFNSLTFILVFLPVALIGFYLISRVGDRLAAAWLVIASCIFYSWWGLSLVLLLGGSIVFNFCFGTLILRAAGKEEWQRWLLRAGVGGDLLLLFYYKYFFSLLNWLGYHEIITLPHLFNVVLPLGISFFTFTQIGYLIDCKGGVVKRNNFLDYCLFVTFFPHLIAGPILHHREMLPQISDPKTYIFQWRNLSLGTVLFVIGLAKKVLIADHFIVAAADTFNSAHDLKLVNAWSGILSYSLQLYFDFSGYSDMAIGMALMFGLRFPANFNSPYRATSIINFWQRWHMTLTRYLTLYLYNPAALWVSRRRAQKGKSIGKKAISTPEGFLNLLALPTFYTMLLAGVWHGAGLQFIIFGLLHGLYLTVNHAWRSFGPRVPEGPSHVAARFLSTVGKVALTYLAVLVAQVFFRATSMHNALDLLAAMAGFHGVTDPSVTLHEMLSQSLLLVALYFVVWMMPNSLQLLDRFTPTLSDLRFDSPIHFSWNPNLVWGVAIGVLACVALLGATGITEFIYFRF